MPLKLGRIERTYRFLLDLASKPKQSIEGKPWVNLPSNEKLSVAFISFGGRHIWVVPLSYVRSSVVAKDYPVILSEDYHPYLNRMNRD